MRQPERKTDRARLHVYANVALLALLTVAHVLSLLVLVRRIMGLTEVTPLPSVTTRSPPDSALAIN